ncbi:DUF2179 domain-containing protein [Mycoplasma sp. OR1901]|uniref:DUF2179 domain-containing protein n=1 Tax=Mycoplasma sp. OR1901 TaxID=2742195 RepID=UPI001581C54D|nr:DUF2179 domain-containing protein [Mycoplasma sp. OR1901]QKT05414.1 YitT family protein [Mycoplasma sp. OR1901]
MKNNFDDNPEAKNGSNIDPSDKECIVEENIIEEFSNDSQSLLNKITGNKFNQDIADVLFSGEQIRNKLVKKNTIYNRTKMSNFGLKLNRLYSIMPMWKLILITVITAIFFGVISVFLVKNVGIYNFGLAAVGQSLARLIVVFFKPDSGISVITRNLIEQFVFWIAYIILSIPIFIFGYKKIGKVFGHLTVIFLVVSSIVSFSIGITPGTNFSLIGDFSNPEIKAVFASIDGGYKESLSSIIPLLWNDGGNIIALFISASVYGFLLAWIFAIIQIIGGTAGVTGIIGEWYANEKQKSFGSISGYMNIIIVIIGVLLGSWLPGSILLDQANANSTNPELIKDITSKAWKFELYLSPNFVATILTNVVYIAVLNKLYPKFKLVKVEIYSMKKHNQIAKVISSDKKIVSGLTKFKAKGGYSSGGYYVITSITLFRQVNRIISDVRKVDEDAFISITDVRSIDGYIYLPKNKF